MTHITIEKEKLEQWLEALENHEGNYKLGDAGCDRHDKAITSIKAALAQDEASSSRVAQEPVAWLTKNKFSGEVDLDAKNAKETTGWSAAFPVYTTPQQRPWVGLVNKEKVLDFGDAHVTTDFARGALWAEAKLKEMNT